MRKFLAAAGLALAALVPAAACAARPPALVPANDRPPATVPAPSCAYPPVRVLGRGVKPGTWLVVSCGRDGEPLPEGAEPKGPDHGPTGTERTIPARQLVSDWSTYWATHGERIEAIEASETVRRLLVDRLRSLGVEVEAASVTGSGALVVRVAPAAAARFLEVLPDTP